MIIKHRLTDLDPLGPVTASLGLATVLLLPAALVVRARPRCRPADAIASVVVLGLVCSALGFLLFFALIAEVGPGAGDRHHLRQPGRRRGPRRRRSWASASARPPWPACC